MFSPLNFQWPKSFLFQSVQLWGGWGPTYQQFQVSLKNCRHFTSFSNIMWLLHGKCSNVDYIFYVSK